MRVIGSVVVIGVVKQRVVPDDTALAFRHDTSSAAIPNHVAFDGEIPALVIASDAERVPFGVVGIMYPVLDDVCASGGLEIRIYRRDISA